MKKMMFVAVISLILNLGIANAINQQEISEAKNLIGSKINCKNLSDSQLEIIGEYYMEQMHPGETHELMHKMMGLPEGSGAEEQFHISMAKTLYCGESRGMMGYGGMIGGGMMGWQNLQNNMMGNFGYGFGYPGFANLLYMILLVGLIILVYLWIIKLWKNKGDKK